MAYYYIPPCPPQQPQQSVDWVGLLKLGIGIAAVVALFDPDCRNQCRRTAQSLLSAVLS